MQPAERVAGLGRTHDRGSTTNQLEEGSVHDLDDAFITRGVGNGHTGGCRGGHIQVGRTKGDRTEILVPSDALGLQGIINDSQGLEYLGGRGISRIAKLLGFDRGCSPRQQTQ